MYYPEEWQPQTSEARQGRNGDQTKESLEQRMVSKVDARVPKFVWAPVYWIIYAPIAFCVAFAGGFIVQFAKEAPLLTATVGLFGGIWLLFGRGTTEAVMMWGLVAVLLLGAVVGGNGGNGGNGGGGGGNRVTRYVGWSIWHSG